MKIRLLIFLLLPLISMAQPARPKMLDINLANFAYPFKVNYLKLHIQNQHLQMAYMDIKPDNYTNKNIVLLHGKNFNGAYWETTINEIVKNGLPCNSARPGKGLENLPSHKIFNTVLSNWQPILKLYWIGDRGCKKNNGIV